MNKHLHLPVLTLLFIATFLSTIVFISKPGPNPVWQRLGLGANLGSASRSLSTTFSLKALEGWPVSIDLNDSSCIVEGVDAGQFRQSLTEDVKAKLAKPFGGEECVFEFSSLFNFQGQDEIQLDNDHTFGQLRSLYYDINNVGFGTTSSYGENELIHDNHVYDRELSPILTLGDGIFSSPIVDDLNGDGINEIIQFNDSNIVITNSNTGNQTILPFDVSYNDLPYGGRVAVGDIDNDGFKEIVSNRLNYIYFDGSNYQSDSIGNGTGDLIAISDLDKNGWNEIVLLKVFYFPQVQSGDVALEIWEQGVKKYPIKLIEVAHLYSGIRQSYRRSVDFALADVVGDERIEIIVPTDYNIYMLDWQTEIIDQVNISDPPEFPEIWFYSHTPVFVYDTNQDGVPEILRPWDKLYIYDNNLELIQAPLLNTGGDLGEPSTSCRPSWPFFTDLNNDNRLDLLSSTSGAGDCDATSTIYAWNTGIPYEHFDRSQNNWINPYDLGNSRCFLCDVEPTCINLDPIITIDPQSQEGLPSDTLSYNVEIVNTDSPVCEPTIFNVVPILPDGFSQDPSSFTTPPIEPQENYEVTINVTSSSDSQPVSHDFSQVATDVDDPQHSGSGTGTYVIPVTSDEGPRVFVTSQFWQGDLGGLGGADNKCQIVANNEELGGIWKAWISDEETSAADRLFHSLEPYRLLNGILIAENWDDLIDGMITHAINLDENLDSVLVDTTVWTGTAGLGGIGLPSDGLVQKNCLNWTSSEVTPPDSTPIVTGLGGHTWSIYLWSNGVSDQCNQFNRLYCFEQPSPPIR